MKKTAKQIMTASVVAAITISNMNSVIVHAAPSRRVTSVLPQAGFTYALGDNQVSLSTLQNSIDEESGSDKGASKKSGKSGSHGDSSTISKSVADKIELSSAVTDATPNASNITSSLLRDILNATGSVSGDEAEGEEQSQDETEASNVDNLVVAKAEGYVNIRDNPSETNGEKIGKLYDKSVGTLIEEKDGWYKIKSGDVTGWVKAQFCMIGQEAADYAQEVATQMGTIKTEEGVLKTRKGPGTDTDVMGYVSSAEEVIILGEEDDSEGRKWYKISMEEGDVFICADYVKPWLDYKVAESNDAEKKRLAEEKAKTDANKKAASKNTSDKAVKDGYKSAASYTTETSSIGSAVAEFAKQFVGNPYVYGGTSLTNGADCSGFVMSVYQNFGVSLPHSSAADRTQGAAVDGLANAQPGDIVCYSGHVAIYIGGGQIVHASTAKTGIKIQLTNPREVGADRVVDAVAAYDLYGGPLIVIDYGTATTYDYVTADGVFAGGVTAPGIRISAAALWRDAAKLPEIAIAKPDNIIGKDTISSMQAGLIHGRIGETEYVIEKIKEEAGESDMKVIATGGLGKLISENTDKIQIYDANLTLKGLKLVYDKEINR